MPYAIPGLLRLNLRWVWIHMAVDFCSLAVDSCSQSPAGLVFAALLLLVHYAILNCGLGGFMLG
jgi:hypothetical protein